jgi:hypothetical protein
MSEIDREIMDYAFTSKEINERLREFFLSISEAPNRSRAAGYND